MPDDRSTPPRGDDARPGAGTGPRGTTAGTSDEGGDAVCWLERVCDGCGALVDGPPEPVCPRCGRPASPS